MGWVFWVTPDVVVRLVYELVPSWSPSDWILVRDRTLDGCLEQGARTDGVGVLGDAR